MAIKAYSPKGSLIVGIVERLTAIASVSSLTLNDDGQIEVEYSGESDIDWDSQEPEGEPGERYFIDDNGEEWPEHQILFTDRGEE